MWASLQTPLSFGLFAALVTTIGLGVVARNSDWSERHASLFALAAGGMLLTLTLLYIAPEAMELSHRGPQFILGGFLAAFVINFLIGKIFRGRAATAQKSEAATPVIAIATHSFLDGIIYSVTFAASFKAGVFAALSLIVHEFPEGMIAFAILRHHGVSNRNAFLFAFLASAVTTPLGVVASAPFLHSVGMHVVGDLFAVSAGLLLYVATGPLLAPIRKESPARGLAALGVGVGLAAMIIMSPLGGHTHGASMKHGGHAPMSFSRAISPI